MNSTWVQSQEWPQFVSKVNHSAWVIQVYAPTTDAEEAEADQFHVDLQDLLDIIPKNMSYSS